MTNPAFAPLRPLDPHNLKLERHVHPRDWINPTPDGKYNLVVIGAGTAGLVSAAGSAGVGAKVALIERDLLGGDCLNVGCVPSKAIIASAQAAATARNAERFGVHVPDGVTVDFAEVMERMRKLRSDISPHDSAERFRGLGIDVFLGAARFTGPNSIEVNGQELHFAKAVIATGARASAPPIEGLGEVEYLTNETLFSLTELPGRFGIVGAGPIGAEMAQTFLRFGSEVTLFTGRSGLLPREDPEAGSLVAGELKREGARIEDYGSRLSVNRNEDGTITLRNREDSSAEGVVVDKLLVAVGRAPNVDGLGLEEAGVDYDETTGVRVDDYLRTTNRSVFAAGDVCSAFKFTHAADFMARNVIRNALFGGRAKTSDLVIPWATYTTPEVAHVGPPWEELDARKDELDLYRVEMSSVDRAILEGETEGFVKIYTEKGKDRIVAATIVARNAGDLISQVSQAMVAGIGLGRIGSTISPYPTQGEAIRKAGDLYAKTRLTPFVAKLLKMWLDFQRR